MSHKKFVDQASGAFMTMTVSLSQWTGITQLKKGSRVAAQDAGANPDAFTGYVKLLGAHHSDLKRVRSLYSAVRTYLYDNTLPFSQAEGDRQQRGERLVPVCRVPEVLTALGILKKSAEEALEAFLPEYDRLVRIAQSVDMGSWKKEVRYPSAEQVRAKFACSVSAPRPIPSVDMSRFGSLPASLANEIAEANSAALEAQLEKAKDAALEQAQAQMDTIIKQLDDSVRISKKSGKPYQPRFHPSLISNSRRASRMLRDMTTGYDNDPRLLALADLIDQKICGTGITTTVWTDDAKVRKVSLDAARTAAKGLKTLAQPVTPDKPVASKKAAGADPEFVAGGMLADLLN